MSSHGVVPHGIEAVNVESEERVAKSCGLAGAREQFLNDMNVESLVREFDAWMSKKSWILIQNKDDPTEYKVIPAVKRGDEIYSRRTLRKLLGVKDWAIAQQKEHFFKQVGRKQYTRACMGSLQVKKNGLFMWGYWEEYVSKRGKYKGLVVRKRRGIGDLFNKFITKMRQHYGKISYVRVWEAHKSGFPHIHVLLIFEDTWFEVYKKRVWNKKKQCYQWVWLFSGRKWKTYNRSTKKWEMRTDGRWWWDHPFKRLWNPSKGKGIREDPWDMSDWKGVYDLAGAIGYQVKYLSKLLTHRTQHAMKNLALQWVYGTRAYSVSKNLLDMLSCLNNSKIYQSKLDGSEDEELEEKSWEVIGIFDSPYDWRKREVLSASENYDGTLSIVFREIDDG